MGNTVRIERTFLFSFGLFQWYKNPRKYWNIIFIIAITLIAIMSILGYLSSVGII
jgi:hypothetical protein